MEILMHRFKGEPYVWNKARFVDGKIMVGNIPVCEKDIVSIRNDDRKKYVCCSVCGTYFKKGSKKIEEHKEGYNDSRMCFGCKYLRQSLKKIQSQKYELLENGNYISKTKSEVVLECYRNYRHNIINSQEARENCIYNRCKNATMNNVTGFFLDKPGAFDSMITIDKIIEAGYKNASYDSWADCTYYTLKGRNRIDAAVNKLNIVEGFVIRYGRESYSVCYSKKYDELYEKNINSTYRVWRPCYMTKETKDYIKNKIAALYN